MSKKSKRKPKHKPQRTCLGCRMVTTKRSMVRIVKTDDGVYVDPTGKMPGRGAYLHYSQSCWETGLKSLNKSLKTNLTQEDIIRLKSYMETLPEGK